MSKMGKEIIKDLKAFVECEHDWRQAYSGRDIEDERECQKCGVRKYVVRIKRKPIPLPEPVEGPVP